MVERYIRDVEVAGSNPVASIRKEKSGNIEKINVPGFFLFIFFVSLFRKTGANLGKPP